jgi:hypothetical protein
MNGFKRAPICLMILALLVQGAVPGVVLCRGEEGHLAMETAFEDCCVQLVPSTAAGGLFLSRGGKEPADNHGCGPCSDTLISINPFTLPASNHASVMAPAHFPVAPATDPAFQASRRLMNPLSPEEPPRLPVETTCLLL